ncbi:hypothetical protein ASE04_16535 [Rhizobium sp. Root708]|nr:hypothetical protein ASE04_16535 [Rhizobium sp. Root708]
MRHQRAEIGPGDGAARRQTAGNGVKLNRRHRPEDRGRQPQQTEADVEDARPGERRRAIGLDICCG